MAPFRANDLAARVAEALADGLKEAGLTVEAAAAALGRPADWVRHALAGTLDLRLSQLEAMGGALGFQLNVVSGPLYVRYGVLHYAEGAPRRVEYVSSASDVTNANSIATAYTMKGHAVAVGRQWVTAWRALDGTGGAVSG